jgi:TrmH family RNA methyltransferase
MGTPESGLDRISIVLVRARDPNNIGAVARAMHDFGFRDLRLASDYQVPLDRARSAVDAAAILKSAQAHASLAEAVADCTLIVGTTAVGARRREQPLYTLAEAAPIVRRELNSTAPGRVALLFGSEKTGLSNEELSHCHWLLTVPMHRTEGMRHASMNLGQAVAVCLYELVRDQGPDSPAQPHPGAPSADLERLTAVLTEVLEASEYRRRHPANFEELSIRRLVRSMALDRSHALAWTGILRQILWKLHQESPQDLPQLPD